LACGNANALSVSRVVEIDTAGGPGFGFEQFKAYDFLREHEVVLICDDGPWPGNTLAVLKALADQCTDALFFPIGKHTMWHPEILKQVAAAGHAIGSHTWSHADLSKLTISRIGPLPGIWQRKQVSAIRGIAEVACRILNDANDPLRKWFVHRSNGDSVDFNIWDVQSLSPALMKCCF
jgi:peptidoglycan/xylan/chitin deacetylase (PgdA/CDA1 family)